MRLESSQSYLVTNAANCEDLAVFSDVNGTPSPEDRTWMLHEVYESSEGYAQFYMTVLADFCGDNLSLSVPECGSFDLAFSIRHHTEIKDRITAKPVTSDNEFDVM